MIKVLPSTLPEWRLHFSSVMKVRGFKPSCWLITKKRRKGKISMKNVAEMAWMCSEISVDNILLPVLWLVCLVDVFNGIWSLEKHETPVRRAFALYLQIHCQKGQIVNKLLQKASLIPDFVTPVLSSMPRCLWISWWAVEPLDGTSLSRVYPGSAGIKICSPWVHVCRPFWDMSLVLQLPH